MDKIKNQRGLSRKFSILLGILALWIKKRNEIEISDRTKDHYRLKGDGRKKDSEEYDELLIYFIKEGRENDASVTSDKVISKAKEIIPDFGIKSFNVLHKRFHHRYFYLIRKVTKIS